MSDDPKENRPDVQVESRVRKDADPNNWYLFVEYTATCRFGCGSFHTSDVVQVGEWTRKHTHSRGHQLAKAEALGEEYKPKPFSGVGPLGGGVAAGLTINTGMLGRAREMALEDEIIRLRRSHG